MFKEGSHDYFEQPHFSDIMDDDEKENVDNDTDCGTEIGDDNVESENVIDFGI